MNLLSLCVKHGSGGQIEGHKWKRNINPEDVVGVHVMLMKRARQSSCNTGPDWGCCDGLFYCFSGLLKFFFFFFGPELIYESLLSCAASKSWFSTTKMNCDFITSIEKSSKLQCIVSAIAVVMLGDTVYRVCKIGSRIYALLFPYLTWIICDRSTMGCLGQVERWSSSAFIFRCNYCAMDGQRWLMQRGDIRHGKMEGHIYEVL